MMKSGYKALLENKDFVFILLPALVIIIFMIFGPIVGPRWDVTDFYEIAMKMKSGLVPYLDFQYEFPPLQLLFIYIPIIFTDLIEIYALIISIMSSLFCIGTLFVLVGIGKELELDTTKIALLYLAIIFVSSYCLAAKIDPVVMFLIALSIYYFIKGRPVVAVTLSVVGAFIKITPAILTVVLFIMIIFDRMRTERVKVILKSVFCSLVVATLTIIPFICMHVPLSQIFSFIGQHSGRGIHSESTIGVLARLMNELGLMDIEEEFNMGVTEIKCAFCDLVSPILLPTIIILFIAFIIFICVKILKSGMPTNRYSEVRLFLLSYVILMMIFFLLNKTFSTQYVIWILPAVVLLELIPNDTRPKYRIHLWLIVYILSLFTHWQITQFAFIDTIRLIALICLEVAYIIELYSVFEINNVANENLDTLG